MAIEKETHAAESVGKPSTRRPLTHREKDIVRALAAVMWADGHAAPAERAVIEQVIKSFDPSEEERREMLSWLAPENVTSIADVELERLTDEQKEVLITDAVLLTLVDDVQLPSEKDVVRKLAKRLGVSDDTVARIIAEARDEGAISLPSTALEERFSLPTPDPTPD